MRRSIDSMLYKNIEANGLIGEILPEKQEGPNPAFIRFIHGTLKDLMRFMKMPVEPIGRLSIAYSVWIPDSFGVAEIYNMCLKWLREEASVLGCVGGYALKSHIDMTPNSSRENWGVMILVECIGVRPVIERVR